jgi:chromosome segregation ATPase
LGVAIVVVLGGIFGVAMSPEASPSSASSQARPLASSTYRSSQLTTLKTRIDQGREQTAALESQLQPVITQLTEMSDQLKKLSAELKGLDEQNKIGLPVDANEYNAKVEIHNGILERRKALFAANSEDLQKYDDLQTQDSALVDEYNGLLKAGGR